MKKFITIILLFIPLFFLPIETTYAACCPDPVCACGDCTPHLKGCESHCTCISTSETGSPSDKNTTMGHITEEFRKQRKWLVDQFFKEPNAKDGLGVLAALKIMASQLTSIGMLQVEVIGTFFDAKHQLETQRLFQQLAAQAHKDYHPSEELCEVGTMARSLATSDRKNDITRAAISKRSTERQLLAKDTIGTVGKTSDGITRLTQFRKKYCNKKDNRGNLELLCKNSENKTHLFNKDINYTATIGSPLTLDLDFSEEGKDTTDDEEALFALTANLFAHEIPEQISQGKFLTDDNQPNLEGAANVYLDWRALTAKRSVAANSIASIAALKTKGNSESQPFIYALIKEMTKSKDKELDPNEIQKLIGDKPSYYAQMDVLTKKIYQTPNFYSDLYDKPANVLRKEVAIQAATLMQKRDLYHSYLRSEMLLAVMLESALIEEQKEVDNEFNKAKQGAGKDPRR